MPNLKLETYKNKATGTVYDYTDAAAQASIAAIEEKIPDVASSENQLVTEAGLNNVLNFKEDKVPGKGLSTNDYTDADKAIVGGIYDFNAKTGVHQLIPYSLASLKANNTGGTWNDNVYTFDNHTFTVNDDLSVTIANTGNTTSSREFYFWKPQSAKELSNVLGRNITISGATGGTPSTYMMTAYRVGTVDGSSGSVYQHTDTEKTFEWKNNCSGTKPLILLGIESGVAVNTTVKPLLRFAEDTCTDFTLPAMTNKELTEKVQGIINAASNAADFAAFKTAIGNL